MTTTVAEPEVGTHFIDGQNGQMRFAIYHGAFLDPAKQRRSYIICVRVDIPNGQQEPISRDIQLGIALGSAKGALLGALKAPPTCTIRCDQLELSYDGHPGGIYAKATFLAELSHNPNSVISVGALRLVDVVDGHYLQDAQPHWKSALAALCDSMGLQQSKATLDWLASHGRASIADWVDDVQLEAIEAFLTYYGLTLTD